MNDLEFSFESAVWEEYIDNLIGSASAVTLLTMTEAEDEQALEDALQLLEDREIPLDISDLPKPMISGEAALRLRQEEQLIANNLNVSALDVNDPLRLYLEEIAMTPAFGDVQLLAEKSRAGDEGAQIALTNLCLSRVIAAASEHTGRGILLLDLIQEGSLGLWHAIQNWTDGDFEQYSDHWISTLSALMHLPVLPSMVKSTAFSLVGPSAGW